MKTLSPQLLVYFAGLRGQPDIQQMFANCFSFTTVTGQILAYTDIDVPVVLGGVTYLANSTLIKGLKFKQAIGVTDDSQQVTLIAGPDDHIGGVPILAAIRNGLLDGAIVRRDRVWFADHLGGRQIGSVNLFLGRVANIDAIGRASAQVTVKSMLALLDIDMPRNLFQPTCLHTLYDSGCTLAKASFGTAGTCGPASTATVIAWPGADMKYQQGSMTFTSGANAGAVATVLSVATGVSMRIGYPLEQAPANGDGFTVYQGCDHTAATCKAKFDNLANFRAFPYVPPAELAV